MLDRISLPPFPDLAWLRPNPPLKLTREQSMIFAKAGLDLMSFLKKKREIFRG